MTVLTCITASCGSSSNDVVEPETTAPAPEEEATTDILHGIAPRATGGFPSVVILEPMAPLDASGRSPLPPEAPLDPAVMDQYNTDFHPRLLVVRVGQTVQFKNSEDTLHNVHVIDIATRETAFNVATPVTGSYDYVFETASVFDVSCGVHPSMAAIIVSTASPYAVVAEVDGAFSFPRVPPGTYNVTVWNLDRSRRHQRVLTLDATTSKLDLVDIPAGGPADEPEDGPQGGSAVTPPPQTRH